MSAMQICVAIQNQLGIVHSALEVACKDVSDIEVRTRYYASIDRSVCRKFVRWFNLPTTSWWGRWRDGQPLWRPWRNCQSSPQPQQAQTGRSIRCLQPASRLQPVRKPPSSGSVSCVMSMPCAMSMLCAAPHAVSHALGHAPPGESPAARGCIGLPQHACRCPVGSVEAPHRRGPLLIGHGGPAGGGGFAGPQDERGGAEHSRAADATRGRAHPAE